MDSVRIALIIFLTGAVAVLAYWWQSVKITYSPTSSPQPTVARDHPPYKSLPQREQNRARQPLEILYPVTDGADGEAEVDIVAIHGLGSNVDWSWIRKVGDQRINWLRDHNMLPAKVPKSRIIVYNYESRWHADSPKTRLRLCGEELVHSVHSFRGDASERPIIFVGHSLGGNVIVHGLLYANLEKKFQYLPKLMQPAGSHRGIITKLDFDEPELLDTLHSFCRLRNELLTPVSCFRELYDTDYGRRFGVKGVAKGMVVEEASACIPGLNRYALQADHFNINKYSGPTDRSFLTVSEVISEMYANAKHVVQRRQDPTPIITDRTRASAERPEASECLQDLFSTDPFEDKNALKRKKGDRALGTCDWVLGTEELTAWLGSSQAAGSENQAAYVLWPHGNPGTGKSTMTIFLTEALLTAFSKTDGKTLAYFFCDSSFDKRKTATSIVRGLILQLVQQHPQLLDYLLPKYKERKAELFNSFDALWTIFMAMAADPNTGRKYCIIDALDECDQESQETLLQQFQETFQTQNVTSNIRILVTSRPYTEIREYLEIFTNKDLASFPQRKHDIDLCIEERIKDLAKKKRYTEKVKEQVRVILKDKAEGTFLWVGLACEELKDTPSKDVVQVLQNMPRGLHSLYKKLLDTAIEQCKDNGDSIRHILSCVTVSFQPLSVLELSEACRLHQDEEDAETRAQFIREHVASCRLMVIIQDEKVLLLHQSVKDYLVGTGPGYFIEELEAHAYVAYRCVDFLIDQFHGTNQPHTSLSFYAAFCWIGHARMAKSTFKVQDSQAEFFQINSPCREQWLQFLRLSPTFGHSRIPQKFSILHMAAWWGVSALVDYVSPMVIQEYDLGTPSNLIHVDHVDDSGVTALEQAVKSGHLDVVSALLGLGGVVTTQVAEAVGRNFENRNEMMTLLLDCQEGQITITEETVLTIAGSFDDKVMSLLLDRWGDQIIITEEVVIAAAENLFDGRKVMTLLSDRRGDHIIITENVVKAAAISGFHGEELMALLLDRQGDQITITEDVVKAAAKNRWNGKEVMALLLDRRGNQITITEDVVKAAAKNIFDGKELMTLLLDRRGDQIIITEEVVKAATINTRVMTLLLDRRGDQIIITEEVIKAATINTGVMTLLLDRRGDQFTITEKIVESAAGSDHAEEVMELLLDRRGDQFTITEKIVESAAGGYRAKEVMELLFDRRGDQFTITEKVVKSAAKNLGSGKEVIALLLDRRRDETTAFLTEDMLRL